LSRRAGKKKKRCTVFSGKGRFHRLRKKRKEKRRESTWSPEHNFQPEPKWEGGKRKKKEKCQARKEGRIETFGLQGDYRRARKRETEFFLRPFFEEETRNSFTKTHASPLFRLGSEEGRKGESGQHPRLEVSEGERGKSHLLKKDRARRITLLDQQHQEREGGDHHHRLPRGGRKDRTLKIGAENGSSSAALPDVKKKKKKSRRFSLCQPGEGGEKKKGKQKNTWTKGKFRRQLRHLRILYNIVRGKGDEK